MELVDLLGLCDFLLGHHRSHEPFFENVLKSEEAAFFIFTTAALKVGIYSGGFRGILLVVRDL